MKDNEISERIKELVKNDFHKIPKPHIRAWTKQHLVEPRQITCLQDNPIGEIKLWLVTDHIGENDSNYRIVYDPDTDKYGLEFTNINDEYLYVGPYGSFADAVDSL